MIKSDTPIWDKLELDYSNDPDEMAFIRMADGVKAMERELSALRAENERLAGDAKRYRWLRDMPRYIKPSYGVYFPWALPGNTEPWIPGEWMTGERLDAAIDTMMTKEMQPYFIALAKVRQKENGDDLA